MVFTAVFIVYIEIYFNIEEHLRKNPLYNKFIFIYKNYNKLLYHNSNK